MDSAPAPAAQPLDARTLLARINLRIALLRAWISHDHGDEPYWWARDMSAPQAQAERAVLRRLADVLHVKRAASRGRLHGTRFTNLDEQRAWISAHEQRRYAYASVYARLDSATFALLRAGELRV